ncbi:MAG TPA: DoxX family protein [Longimicrobium sp.]|nr:DoxX family protein [Longimicrobium sp.]
MSIHEPSDSPWTSRMLSIFRIVAGVIFFSSGTMKIFGFPENPMPNMPPIELWSQIGIGGMLEIVCGLAIIVGLYTRPVSFLMAGMMAVAYFQFHQPQAFWPTNNGGVAAVMYCFFFLYLMFAGAGAWSLDAIIARRARGGAHAGRPAHEPEMRTARA